MNAWLAKLYDTFIASGGYKFMLEGLGNTILITLGALIIGVVLGAIIAVIKYFGEDVPWLKPFAKLCSIYVTVIRGIPVVVLLIIFYYLVMASVEPEITLVRDAICALAAEKTR